MGLGGGWVSKDKPHHLLRTPAVGVNVTDGEMSPD